MTAGNEALTGIHHVTAICSDAQQNIDFFCGVLGLRLVKLTVNFDDLGSYHLYYADGLGRPGTIMTYFAWPGAERGRVGPPQATATAFAVPAQALEYWAERLARHGTDPEYTKDRFGEAVLLFVDPDGMPLELVAVSTPVGTPWAEGPIPAEHAIRAFHSVTLSEAEHEPSATLLTTGMGYRLEAEDGKRRRYTAGAGDGLAASLDIVAEPDAPQGRMGAGVVHHVAFRVPDDAAQEAWHQRLTALGYGVSPVRDRIYFHSIYYREPGGVLFEIATEDIGFTLDEPAEGLGTGLKLPPWLEARRAQITTALPPVQLPTAP